MEVFQVCREKTRKGRRYSPQNNGRSPLREEFTRRRDWHPILQFNVYLRSRLSLICTYLSRGTKKINKKCKGTKRGADLCSWHTTAWHHKEVSFQWVKWKLQEVARLELSCHYQKIWLWREKIPKVPQPHTNS